MVEKDDSGYVSMSTGDIDQQRTRRGQSCVLRSTHDDSVDLDRIQFMPTHDTSLPSVRTASLDYPLLGPTIMPASDRTLGGIPFNTSDKFTEETLVWFQIPMTISILYQHDRVWNVTCQARRLLIFGNRRQCSLYRQHRPHRPTHRLMNTRALIDLYLTILNTVILIEWIRSHSMPFVCSVRGQQVDLERLTLYEIGQLEELSDLQDDMTIYDTVNRFSRNAH